MNLNQFVKYYARYVGALQQGGGTGGICPPTLKSRGTSYVLVPSHFYHIFILIGWSPLHTNHRFSAPNDIPRHACVYKQRLARVETSLNKARSIFKFNIDRYNFKFDFAEINALIHLLSLRVRMRLS